MDNKKNVTSAQVPQEEFQVRAPRRLQTAEGWKREQLKKMQRQRKNPPNVPS